jgi:hypothetical protein
VTSVALIVISDGRQDYLTRTLLSAAKNLPPVDHVIHVDDSAHDLGFAGAIQAAWDEALQTDCTHLFHLEGDFTLDRPVPLRPMLSILHVCPYLVQIALLRQPWNDAERAAGGIWQQHPDSYKPVTVGPGVQWLEHRRFFTTNPSLYPRWVAERGWPQQRHSEGVFGLNLFGEDPARRAAFWGDGSEWVTHIGDERHGHGY